MIVTLRRGRAVLSHHESLGAALLVITALDGPERRVVVALRPFTFLSICSGIEAASVAWSPLGWRPLAFAEIEKFPSAVLAHHYPRVPNHGDFTKIDARRYRGRVDILCGGTPCQAFSVAGARNSLDDVRGNLTLAFVDLAHAINPRNVVWENVPGVLSTKDNAFGCFLAGLVGAPDALVPIAPRPAPKRSSRHWGWSAKSGQHYVKWPRSGMVDGPKGRAAWTIKDAQYFGLAQRRERVLVVADFGNGADPAAVLFEPEGVRRHSPPSRETGQGIAPTISARTKGGGGLGTDFDLDGGLIHAIQAGALRENPNSGPDGVGVQADIAYTLEARAEVQAVSYAPEIARRNATREGSSQDFETTTMVAVGVAGSISHALAAEGADASEDGTGRGTPIVTSYSIMPMNSGKDYKARVTDIAQPILAAGPGGGNQGGDYVVQSIALRGRDGGATAELGDDVAFALRASGGGGDKPHVLAFDCKASGQSGFGVGEIAGTMRAMGHANTHQNGGGHSAVAYGSAVRRLTPRECERLQGFQFLVSPDYPQAWQDDAGRWWSPDYTAIPVRKVTAANQSKARADDSGMFREIDGEMWIMASDGPRYKSLGNSWAMPKFRWLGRRIQRLMPPRR